MSNTKTPQATRKVKVISGKFVCLDDYLTLQQLYKRKQEVVKGLADRMLAFEERFNWPQFLQNVEIPNNETICLEDMFKEISEMKVELSKAQKILDNQANKIKAMRLQNALMVSALMHIVRHSHDGGAVVQAGEALDECTKYDEVG